MFERIGIQHQNFYDPEHPLDLGFLAEAMLFYDTVEVIANRAVISQLVREIGAEPLCEFLAQRYLTLKFEPNLPGIQNNGTGANEVHSLVLVSLQGSQLISTLQSAVLKSVGRPGKARRLALRLAKFVEEAPVQSELLAAVSQDLRSLEYTSQAAAMVIQTSAPGAPLPAQPKFEIIPVDGDAFQVASNFDYDAINAVYHQRVAPSHSTITKGLILSHLLNASKILEDCAVSGSEIATSEIWSKLITLKISDALRSRIKSAQEISAFQDFVLDSGRAITEAINTGQRNFAELLPLLEAAKPFRKWLQKEQFSAELVKNYFREVTAQSWVDKLPAKGVRWAFFAAAGLGIDTLGAAGAGTAGAMALGLADTFLVDKILKGWKPNQFVERSLEPFVTTQK